MIRCEYCNKEFEDLTKEHVFPDFFYEILGLKDNQVKYLSYNESLGISNRKELFIKKVCSTCNNKKLSNLDTEFSILIKPFILNDKFIIQNINYYKIIRWLIKTFFNSYLYIDQKSMIEQYKNKFIKLILNEKKIENELLFSISLKGNDLNNSFMSIGTIIRPYNIVKYLDICNFIQIKNHLFLLIIFKKAKYLKQHSKELINYLKKEYNAFYHTGIINIENTQEKILEIEYIYNANEDNTNIPFKLLCKLQWNLDRKIKSINEKTLEKVSLKNHLFINQLINNSKVLYTTMKHLFICFEDISVLVNFKTDLQIIEYPYHICSYSYDDIDKVNEYKDANIIINRYDNFTRLIMKDLNDIKNPFIENLNIPQSEDNWKVFKENIKKNDNYIYIAIAKSKTIEKEFKNGSFKNLNFVSKIKVINLH